MRAGGVVEGAGVTACFPQQGWWIPCALRMQTTKHIPTVHCVSRLGPNHRRLHENKFMECGKLSSEKISFSVWFLESTAQGASVRCHMKAKWMYKQVGCEGYKNVLRGKPRLAV